MATENPGLAIHLSQEDTLPNKSTEFHVGLESGTEKSGLFATRRALLVGASGLAAAAGLAGVAKAETETAQFLFVQTSKGMTFDAATQVLTLTGVSPITLFFTDRPERTAGNMRTTAFIPFWNEGKDSFKSDPPNADVSVLDGNKLIQTIAELQDPVLDGDSLSYTVKIISGTMPASGADVSVFIDVIGMPLTPVSVAGVDRRAFRRAAIY